MSDKQHASPLDGHYQSDSSFESLRSFPRGPHAVIWDHVSNYSFCPLSPSSTPPQSSTPPNFYLPQFQSSANLTPPP